MKDVEKFLSTIEEKARAWDISAAISLMDNEGLAYQKAFGYADRAEKRALTLADRFCVNAENGFFLTLCVLQLMEQKKLRLSDKISRFLPEYKQGGRITVRNLLRWNSGLEDYWQAVRMPALQKDPSHAALDDAARFRKEFVLGAADVSFQEVLRDIGEHDLTHEPGRSDDGSWTGLVFLCEIVRRVSGQSPREYLFAHFFAPLGMADTHPGNGASTALYGVIRDTELVRLPSVAPAAAFTTTVQDMAKLARALVEKQFFSEKTWALMLKCDVNMMSLGFFKRGELYETDLFPARLRDTCQIYLNFESGTAIVVLNNEEFITRLDEHRHWRSFPGDLRLAWQNTRVYPDQPQLKRVNGTNVWETMGIELRPEQLSFVPECTRCIATTLANRQPVYVLMDHGVAVGMAALTVKPKKKEFSVSFLQVDYRYQGRGYGRILLTRALEILKTKGAKELEIGVNRFNIPAQRLYRSVGFQDKEVYDDFIELKMTL